MIKKFSDKKIVLASVIGNTLEFYDFSLFVFLSPILAPLFFPASDPLVSLIAALATYGVGYFMRPIGAIFFGHLGDKYGRKYALSLSIILMSIPTVLMAVLPTYAQIGVTASLLLILLRLVQGFCAGGEFNGAGIFVVENTHTKKSSFYGSFISSSTAIGGLLGSGISSIVTLPTMPSWSWRIAFILGGVVGIVGLYMRRQLIETVPLNLKKNAISKAPFLESIKTAYPQMLATIGIAAFAGSMYHLSVYYISVFLSAHANWHLSDSLFLMSIGTMVYILTVPFFGRIADKYGNKKIMLTGAIASLLSVYPLFSLLLTTTSFYQAVSIQICLALLSGWYQAPMTAYLAKLFPLNIRYSGLAFSYNIGIALFGGTTPVICSALIRWTKMPIMPAFYIILMSILGFCAVKFSKERESLA